MAIEPIAVERYAEAVFNRAQKEGVLEALEAEVRAILPILGKNRDLPAFFGSPRIKRRDKRAMIEKVFAGSEATQLDELALLLLDKGRLDHFGAILRQFLVLCQEARGEFPASVTTARDLTDEERGRMQTALERHTGHRLSIDFRVDPETLGGVVFRHRDEMIDTSLRSGLRALRERMARVRVH